MKVAKRFTLTMAATVGLVMVAMGCGGGDGAKIALLLPGIQPADYEATNRRDFEKRVEEICSGCEVLYSNAGGDSSKQEDQVKAALRQGVEVLVLDPADPSQASAMVEEAKDEGVPVLAYGPAISNPAPDASVSFDYLKTGELQAEMLAEKLREEGHPEGPIVMVKGEPGNGDQHFFEEGAQRVFAAEGVKIAREYFTPFWYERYAKHEMQRAIRKVGRNGFAGVYAETDSIAGGVIAALKSVGIDPTERPTTGRNASIAAVQRILSGEQYMTAYEPVERLAARGAEFAVGLARGDSLPQGQSTEAVFGNVPSALVGPVAVTRSNVERTVIADGLVSPAELCAGSYRAPCRAAGIPGI